MFRMVCSYPNISVIVLLLQDPYYDYELYLQCILSIIVAYCSDKTFTIVTASTIHILNC